MKVGPGTMTHLPRSSNSLLNCNLFPSMSMQSAASRKMSMLNARLSSQSERRVGSNYSLSLSGTPLGLPKDSDKVDDLKDEPQSPIPLKKKSHKKVLLIENNGAFQLSIPKNFICEHCYGAFRSSYHLKRHTLIHTGEKPFECDVCSMRFIQKYHLDRHKRVHSGEKPYECERCHQFTSFHPHTVCHSLFYSRVLLCFFNRQLFFTGPPFFHIFSYCFLAPSFLVSSLFLCLFAVYFQTFSRTDRLLRHKRMCQGSHMKSPHEGPFMM